MKLLYFAVWMTICIGGLFGAVLAPLPQKTDGWWWTPDGQLVPLREQNAQSTTELFTLEVVVTTPTSTLVTLKPDGQWDIYNEKGDCVVTHHPGGKIQHGPAWTSEKDFKKRVREIKAILFANGKPGLRL